MLPDAAERPLLTVDEYVEATGGRIHKRSAAYDAIERGELPAIRLGRRWFVKTAEVRRLFGLDSAGSIPERATAPVHQSGAATTSPSSWTSPTAKQEGHVDRT